MILNGMLVITSLALAAAFGAAVVETVREMRR